MPCSIVAAAIRAGWVVNDPKEKDKLPRGFALGGSFGAGFGGGAATRRVVMRDGYYSDDDAGPFRPDGKVIRIGVTSTWHDLTWWVDVPVSDPGSPGFSEIFEINASTGIRPGITQVGTRSSMLPNRDCRSVFEVISRLARELWDRRLDFMNDPHRLGIPGNRDPYYGGTIQTHMAKFKEIQGALKTRIDDYNRGRCGGWKGSPSNEQDMLSYGRMMLEMPVDLRKYSVPFWMKPEWLGTPRRHEQMSPKIWVMPINPVAPPMPMPMPAPAPIPIPVFP